MLYTYAATAHHTYAATAHHTYAATAHHTYAATAHHTCAAAAHHTYAATAHHTYAATAHHTCAAAAHHTYAATAQPIGLRSYSSYTYLATYAATTHALPTCVPLPCSFSSLSPSLPCLLLGLCRRHVAVSSSCREQS